MWDTIFKAGRQTDSKGRERLWTEAELDRLAQSTEVPLVATHPADEGEAERFGQTAELRRVGSELQARYRDVPEALQQLVKGGLKLAKSVAIDPASMRITHIGLLGAGQPPAVSGLGPITFNETQKLIYSFQEGGMDEKDKRIQELEQQVATLTAEKASGETKAALEHAQAELKKEQDAHAASKAEFAQFRQQAEDKALSDRIDALAATGRIFPADKGKTLIFAKAMEGSQATMTFTKKDGSGEQVSPREMYLRELEARQENHVGLLHEFAAGGEWPESKETVDLSKINNYA